MRRAVTDSILVWVFFGYATAGTLTVVADRDATLIEHPDGNLGNGAGPVFFAGRTNQADNAVRRALISFDVTPRLAAGAFVRIEKVTLVVAALPSNVSIREFRLHPVLAPCWSRGPPRPPGGELPSLPGEKRKSLV